MIKSIKDTPKEVNMLRVIFILSLFLWGGFLPAVSCGLTVLLSAYIVFMFLKARNNAQKKDQRHIRIPMDPVFIFTVLLVICLGLACIWAVDKGMAPYGVVKFLPLPLFAAALYATGDKGRATIICDIPYIGAAMTVLSAILALIPAIRSEFIVFGRLAGFMQYSNTFAVLCLAGSVILLLKETSDPGIRTAVTVLILYAGIILSGSRTVFMLWILSIPVVLIIRRNRKLTLLIPGGAAFFIIASILYVAVSGRFNAIGRFLNTSLEESTFLGRFLYYKDLIPVILSHPFGLGYKGYQVLQTSFQTGDYNVLYVHNDYLQVFADAGWIPGIAALVCLFLGIKKIIKDPAKLVPVIIIALHILFDFDLQSSGICFVMIALLSYDDPKEIRISSCPVIVLLSSVFALMSIYLGTADVLHLGHLNDAALGIYPNHTDALTEVLENTEDIDVLESYADRILKVNGNCSIAYSAKSRALFAKGDVQGMIDNKLKAIANNRYELGEYEDFVDYLNRSVEVYIAKGDEASAVMCIRYIIATDDMVNDVIKSTSDMAWKTNDSPFLDWPDEYRALIDEYKQQLGTNG